MLRSFSHTPFCFFSEFSLPRCRVKSNEFLTLHCISWYFKSFYVVFITTFVIGYVYLSLRDICRWNMAAFIHMKLTFSFSIDILLMLTDSIIIKSVRMTPFILWELTTARQKICRAAFNSYARLGLSTLISCYME